MISLSIIVILFKSSRDRSNDNNIQTISIHFRNIQTKYDIKSPLWDIFNCFMRSIPLKGYKILARIVKVKIAIWETYACHRYTHKHTQTHTQTNTYTLKLQKLAWIGLAENC